MDFQTTHPLKVFDLAKSQGRLVYASAPMVRYSKLAFRQTVYAYGVDLCWTPMIVAKEFNRNQFARDSDLTLSTRGPQPPTIVQFGASSPLEFSRASSMVAPFVSGVDLNCGCPQSWACAESLGAALMDKRELVRDIVVDTRQRLQREGWAVGLEQDMHSPKGRSISVKIRVHKDLRKTMDFIDTVLGHDHNRQIDFLTIHPRTRRTPSKVPINTEALEILTTKYGNKLPILVSGDVFTLGTLPYTSPLLPPTTITPSSGTTKAAPPQIPALQTTPAPPTQPLPHLPHLAGLMSARALLANPALFSGHDRCPWAAVHLFMNKAAHAPLPFRLVLHHLSEMCSPGLGPDKRALLSKKERVEMMASANMCELIDFLDARVGGGLRRDERVVEREKGEDG